MAGLYTVLGIWPTGAWLYFGSYALSRCLHTFLLLHPRQPLRNRVFAVGILCLGAMLVHIAVHLAALA